MGDTQGEPRNMQGSGVHVELCLCAHVYAYIVGTEVSYVSVWLKHLAGLGESGQNR